MKSAAESGDINLLYSLIQDDPYVLERLDAAPFGETPLHVAASAGQLQFATEMARLKASFSRKLNPQGMTPIHLAMQHGHRNMVLRFVDMDTELVRAKGREGLTPIHLTTQIVDTHLLADLLSACPDSIQDVTVSGETALHLAVRAQQSQSLGLLLGWLRRTRKRFASQLERTILNWRDHSGNTALHLAALLNHTWAVKMLVKSKIEVKAKNFDNSTALDLAESGEVKSILANGGAKRGSSITDHPTLSDKLRSHLTLLDRAIIFILRVRRDITEDQRNAFLVVAALIATATYQAALNPPGGFYQASAGDPTNTTSTTNQGTSVINEGDFLTLSIFNSLSMLVCTLTIFILTPSGLVGSILFSPIFWFAYSYFYSMKVISPTPATTRYHRVMVILLTVLYSGVYWTFSIGYKRLHRYAYKREVKTRKAMAPNRW